MNLLFLPGGLGIALVFSGYVLTVNAAPADNRQPLYVDAGQCVFDMKSNQSRCAGGMQVRQGSLHIDATKGTVFRQGKRVVRIELHGNPAVFRYVINPQDGLMVAQARYMDYRKAEDLLILKGNVMVKNPTLGTFSGEKMVINLRTEEITGGEGDGDQRVHMVVEPDAENLSNASPADEKKADSSAQSVAEQPESTGTAGKSAASPMKAKPPLKSHPEKPQAMESADD